MMKRLAVLILIACLSFCILGCDDSDSDHPDYPDTVSPPMEQRYSIEIVGGNFQSGYIWDDDLEPLVLRVSDEKGNPAEKIRVGFDILKGSDQGKASASFWPDEVFTDEEGFAQTKVNFGKTPGMVRIRGRLLDENAALARPVIFNLSSYPQATDTTQPICILSINDFHSHNEAWEHPDDTQGGLARIVWLFKQIRAANDAIGVPTVILDAGDDFENTAYHDIPGYLPWLIKTWDAAGVDVWQVGNHDYHFGLPFLTDILQTATPEFASGIKGHKMGITFGNVDPSTLRDDLTEMADLFETDFADDQDQALYQQAYMLNAGPIRIGILGVTSDAAIYTQVVGDPAFFNMIGAVNPDSEGLTFFNPDPRESDYINTGIDRLTQAGADMVLVLSHTGLGLADRVNIPPGKDHLIAQYGQGPETGRIVDLIVGGHSHVQLNKPIFLTNPAGSTTPIVQAREGGLFVSRVDGVVNTEAGGFSVVDARLLQVNGLLKSDETVEAEIAEFRQDASSTFDSAWFDTTLTQSPVWLSHRAQTPSALGNLINDAFLWKVDQEGYEVDGAVAIPSLYRTDIWPGDLTAPKAYQVLPLHKMDEAGTNPDTLAVLTFRPGLFDCSTLNLPGTDRTDITIIEYLLELVHSLPDLADAVPAFGAELKIEVFQMAGVSYVLDVTAPAYNHIVEGSVTIAGQPVDSNTTYKVVMVETLATTLSAALNTLIVAKDDQGETVSPLLPDDETALPYTDTGVPLWLALEDYLLSIPGTSIDMAELTVTGDSLRTVQPDLSIDPTEVSVDQKTNSLTFNATLKVRNLGDAAVRRATITLWVDSTPWDLTDQNDGMAGWEGLGGNYTGSLTAVAQEKIEIAGYPAEQEVEFNWEMPEDWPKGIYTLHPKITDIEGEVIDPNTGDLFVDPYMDNNDGEQVMVYFENK